MGPVLRRLRNLDRANGTDRGSARRATFCVGLEFSYAQKFDERWRKIIAAVRKVYHGKITYGGNWDSFQEVKFWDALDYIGVLAYFPLTKSVNPSEAEIATAWNKKCAELDRLFKRRTATRNFSSSEIGYNESARAAAEPWAFKTGGENADRNSTALHRGGA